MEFDNAALGFERLVSEGTPLETIAEGFMFTEGPVWHHDERHLRFSDIPGDKLYQWSPSEGVTVYLESSAKSNGLTYDRHGQLLICEHVGRRVSRVEADGSLVSVASHYGGQRLNSPNDVVVKSDGAVYFSDPNSGIKNDYIGALADQELDWMGVYRLSPDGSELTLLDREFNGRPNGLAFSPDESLLYVDDTPELLIKVYDVRPDGTGANGRVFARTLGDEPGMPDGMKVDVEGNVYCTAQGGVHVFAPDGRLLGRIRTPTRVANLAWGDDDWQTLYLTGTDKMYRLRMNVAGIPVGPW
jgi:gluconolactonase